MNNYLKVNLDAFIFFFKMSPKYWIVYIVNQVINVFYSYTDLFLFAKLINQFVAPINLSAIIKMIVYLIIFRFSLNIIKNVMDYFTAVYYKEFINKENLFFLKKFLNVEYSDMEKTHFRQLRRTIAESENAGYGKIAYIDTVKGLFYNIFSVIVSTYLFVCLFISLIKNGIDFGYICLFLLLFVFIISKITLNNYVSKKINGAFASKVNEFVRINRVDDSIDSYSQGKDIRLYRQNEYILNVNKEIFSSWKKIWEYIFNSKHRYYIPSAILSRFEYFYTSFFLIHLVFIGKMLPGSYFSNLGYMENFSKSLFTIFANISFLKNNTEHIERYISFCDYKEKSRDGFTFDNVHFNKVSFNNVSFKYPGCEETVLKNISINIKKGKKYAVVGQNGSGKSTFIKLLCRLYEPEEGCIQIDNYKACEINIDDYWKMFSVIFQDFNLFSFTLGQNISVCDSPSEEQLLSIIEKVGFSDRYKDMEQGLDTLLYKNFDEKGVEISGGEAQKIALARAIYKDGEIFILDEPTAALDPIAESELYDNFNKIVQDKTVIYISHRLASCKFCDEIIVFDKGQIVQSGTHESLLKDKKGKYYELWTAQAKHYNT